MSTKILIESIIKDGSLDKLLLFLEENLPNTRAFAGCLNVTILLNKDTRKMIFDEEWLSVEHHQEYIKSISNSGVMNALVSYLESNPEIKYLERIVI
jgi:quinol monooxygenase YgiN